MHLDKGCYRGQETVARVHNLGRPPRRLTLLHLDGSENRLPTAGVAGDVSVSDVEVGTVGSSARHYEAGPIALALSSATSRWTPSWRSTGSRPPRRSSSTPRSACTSARLR